MIMRTSIILLLFVALCCGKLGAQTPERADTTVTGNELPLLTEQFFMEQNFLSHEYNQEIKNKVSRLRMWSRDVAVAGTVALLGVMAVNGILVSNNDWSLWIDIPCATVVGMGVMIPFFTWSNRLSKKADALEAQTAFLWHTSKNMELGMTRFDTRLLLNDKDVRRNSINWGLTLKASF